jgi:intein/homing endonuclease
MGRRWIKEEEKNKSKELRFLYVRQNKNINEISAILKIAPQTVFQRLQRLKIPTSPEKKSGYLHKHTDIQTPKKRTKKLAEFFGIMLGDGHISDFQTIVSLGTKEMMYAEYVAVLMGEIFKTKAKVSIRKDGYKDVYISSVELSTWLQEEGLVFNKVKSQVGVPKWIFSSDDFMRAFLRGFFDTDGSVYRLRYGIQISLTNKSLPLLVSLQKMLFKLQYKPSGISSGKVYVTNRDEIFRFFTEIKPSNIKHINRFKEFGNKV